MKLYPKIDLHVDGFYWTTTQRYPTLSKALQALKSQAPAYIQSGQPSRFLEASFPDSSGSRRIKIYENRKKKTRKKVARRKRRSMALSESQRKLLPLYLRGNRGLTPRQQKMLDFLKRVYPQYSELAKDSATKKDASRLARLKLIKVRSFKRTGTSRGKRFSMMIMEARAMAPKGGQLSSPYLGLARNPARTDKAHFGYAKMGMELLGTGLKIAKGERVYMTPATNIPGGGFFVEPAYRTGLWKQVSDGAILIKPKDFDDEITYVEPRGEYRPTPQVKPDYKYGIYTGRGIARNPMRSFASLHPSDRAKLKSFFDYVYSYYGKGGLYARDFKNGGFDRKTIERAIMVYIGDVRKGKTEWGGGDSIDRERVRTILQPSYSMFIPEGKMTIRKNRRSGLRGNPRLGKYEQKALNFARKYPGWHGFDPRKPTANIVRRLEKKGLVKVSDISNQFRAI